MYVYGGAIHLRGGEVILILVCVCLRAHGGEDVNTCNVTCSSLSCSDL